MPLICCEGPTCNAGQSALQRETALTVRCPTYELRDLAERDARRIVSRALAVTPHVHVSTTRRAGIALAVYACVACNHERVYGNSVTEQDSPYV